MTRLLVLGISVGAVAIGLLGQDTPEDKCSRTAQMQIYSNAYISKETGDVVGYELAIKKHDDSTVDALLYVYEGTPNNDGIPLSGRISGKNLTIQGNWVEHLVEYPSKKKIVQTHFVKMGGTLDSVSFQGKVEIEGNAPPGESRLERLEQIWVCRTPGRKKS
jgi:hypothetical protein